MRVSRREIPAKAKDIAGKRPRVKARIEVDGEEAGKGETFPVRGEELLLYSVLANLAANAVEAAPRGSAVAIGLDRRDGPRLMVHNRGIIPSVIRGCFGAHFATSVKEGGTGLGA